VCNSSVFWQNKSTHTRHGLPKERRSGAYACAVVEAFAAPLILLCMSAAATDLALIVCSVLFCSVLLFVQSSTAVHRNTTTQHTLSHTLLKYHTTIAYIPILAITTSRPACPPTYS
jgi:hypothetical protein